MILPDLSVKRRVANRVKFGTKRPDFDTICSIGSVSSKEGRPP